MFEHLEIRQFIPRVAGCHLSKAADTTLTYLEAKSLGLHASHLGWYETVYLAS